MDGSDDAEPRWTKSSHSGVGECLEWLVTADAVHLRHSHRPDGPQLTLTHGEWRAFLAGVRSGEAHIP